ncbi:hypothetical protein GJ496_002402 [Pomphorhynchus laevis]|nr:hypothetical protein GJ496_002402 [Pomphorhynchus laevis]
MESNVVLIGPTYAELFVAENLANIQTINTQNQSFTESEKWCVIYRK